MEYVSAGVKTDTLDINVINLVRKDIMAEAVPMFVLLTVRRVGIQTDCVLVWKDGWDMIVLMNVTSRMEKIVCIHAVNIV